MTTFETELDDEDYYNSFKYKYNNEKCVNVQIL